MSSEDVSKPKYMQFTDLPLLKQHYCFKKGCFLLLQMSTFAMLHYLSFLIQIRLPPVSSVHLLQPISIVSYLGKLKVISVLLQTSSEVTFASKLVLNISVVWRLQRTSSP